MRIQEFGQVLHELDTSLGTVVKRPANDEGERSVNPHKRSRHAPLVPHPERKAHRRFEVYFPEMTGTHRRSRTHMNLDMLI